jgi:transposase-like protein
MSYPSIYQISNILFNEDECINFLKDKRVFYNNWRCYTCNKDMKYYQDRYRFRCTTKNCGGEISIRKNTFFDKHRLPVHKILHIGYLWLKGDCINSIAGATGHTHKKVAEFLGHYRELISDSLNFEDNKIGGPGIHVQIDETKCGKRKYNRGHQVDGAWVLGGVEKTEERKIFIIPVQNRTAETLLEAINHHVLPGSIISTDLWRGYNSLNTINSYAHLTVNHSKHFKDPESGANTNTIEGTWSTIKSKIPIRCRTKQLIEPYLWEFIWRRKNHNSLWDALINALAEVHYN